jgi:hypothetical protein
MTGSGKRRWRRPRLGLRPPPPRSEPPPPALVLGHRGGMAHAPENSLQAIESAKDLGADGVELDVRMRGGRLICAHDSDQKGPDLIDALELARSLDLWVEIDLKSAGRDGAVHAVVDAIAHRPKVWVSTFHPYAAWLLRWTDPGLVVGWALLPDRLARPLLWTPWIAWLGVQVVEPHVSLISPLRLTRWQHHSLRVVTWGVEPAEAPSLLSRGVSVVMDDPRPAPPRGSPHA